MTETDGLELLVVTNTIPQVSFLPINLKQRGKSTKALPLSQEGRLEKCDKLRVIDVTPTFAEALRYIMSIVQE